MRRKMRRKREGRTNSSSFTKCCTQLVSLSPRKERRRRERRRKMRRKRERERDHNAYIILLSLEMKRFLVVVVE